MSGSRFRIRLAVAVAILAGGLTAARAAHQDWRGPALAAFDDVWETINETFYDRSFGGVDWAATRRELRPRAEAATSADGVRAVIREMLARLGRSHFGLMSSAASNETLPGPALPAIEVRIVDERVAITGVTPGSAAAQAGVRAGQFLIAIDGEPTAALRSTDPGRDRRGRDFDQWRATFRALHGSEGSDAMLRVRDADGTEHTLAVKRAAGAGERVQLGNLPPLQVVVDVRAVRTPGGRDAGYLGFNIWMTAIGAPIAAGVDRFRQSAGLVFDLRGNPGGLALMINGLAGHVLEEEVELGTMQTRHVPDPLTFKANPRFVTDDGRRVTPFAGPVAILVDELTASTSETFAGALQSIGRARVFGRQTLGQVLPALTKKLPNNDILMYAMGDFVTPTGRRLEGVGVVPDEVVPLSVAALAKGQDEALEAALRWIDGEHRRR